MSTQLYQRLFLAISLTICLILPMMLSAQTYSTAEWTQNKITVKLQNSKAYGSQLSGCTVEIIEFCSTMESAGEDMFISYVPDGYNPDMEIGIRIVGLSVAPLVTKIKLKYLVDKTKIIPVKMRKTQKL